MWKNIVEPGMKPMTI